MSQQRTIALLLDNIRSVHNVASMFRTADAFAVEKIYCLGVTPTPLDRFGRARSDFAKVSLGAEKTVPWESGEDVTVLIKSLRERGYHIVALEQGPRAIPFSEVKPPEHVALIVGNEVDGVSEELIEAADSVVAIPMRGTKESLNVSVAAGIALAALRGI